MHVNSINTVITIDTKLTDMLRNLQEMCEFRKLLSHLNKMIAFPVCIFTILNLSYTFSAIIYFIKIYNQYTAVKILCLGICNILLWLIIGLYPFFQVCVENVTAKEISKDQRITHSHLVLGCQRK